MTRVIGLTGGIAAGKSTAAEHLARLGARVIDADGISRSLTAKGGPALPLIREQFGDGVFDGGELNRQKLAQEVFGSEEKRQKLNEIIHPLVYDAMAQEVARAKSEGLAALVLDIPLLFETGYEKICDEVWLVVADENARLQRLIARSGIDIEQAQARIASQMPESEKLKRLREHDKIIDNNGGMEHIIRQVEGLWRKIRG